VPAQEGDYDSASASDALQGAAGQRAGVREGLPTSPVGAPQPAVPVSPGQAAAATAGTATAPTPIVQATPNAAADAHRGAAQARARPAGGTRPAQAGRRNAQWRGAGRAQTAERSAEYNDILAKAWRCPRLAWRRN
jgi:hypothetical protein